MVSGNGQLIPERFLATQALVVRAVDAAGRGIENVPIEWKGVGLGLTSQVTDASGYASAGVGGSQFFQLESFVHNTITASSPYGSVDFTTTTFSTTPVGGGFVGHPQITIIFPTQELTGPPGTVIRRAFGVRVAAQGGLQAQSPIPRIGFRTQSDDPNTPPIATCQGVNGMVFTDENGEAFCDLVLGSTPGFGSVRGNIGDDSLTPPFLVNITAGPACTYTVNPATQAFSTASGTGTIAVTSGQNCAWTATSSASWVTVTSGGTGQAVGTVAYSVQANTGVARSATISIGDKTVSISQAGTGGGGVNPGGLAITTTSPIPAPTVGSPYSFQFVRTGGTAPFTWSAGGTFPPGLGLDPVTGGVTGTPTTPGTFQFSITVRDVNNASVTVPFTATVSPASTGTLVITTTSLPAGGIGTAYSQTLTATGACGTGTNPFTGGQGAVTWSVASGSLPPGLTLAQAGTNATLSGTPNQEGTYTFSIRAQDTCNRVATQSYTVTFSTTVTANAMVVTPSPVEISVAYTAAASPDQTVRVSTGTAGVSFDVTTTTPWLTITPTRATTPDSIIVRATGIAAFAPGTYNGSFVVTSGASNSPVTVPVTLRVAPPSNVTVGQESFLFRHTLANPTSQQILNVASLVPGTRFFLTFETEAGGAWLNVSPTRSETPAAIAIIVNTAGLANGTYRGIVRVIPDGNAGGRIEIPVTAIVSPITTLTLPQTQLTFNGPGTQTVNLGTTTGTGLGFTAQTNGAPWLTVTPPSGTAPSSLSVGASAAGLAPGRYEGAVLITPAGGGQTLQIGVVLNVSEGQPVVTGIANAASFAPGGVAPGEIVTIFGTNLGPATLVSGTYDTTGTLQTTVGNVRVLFDNVPAPVIYAAAGQVSTIVPFGVFGRTATRVQVVNGTLPSNTIEVPVVESKPGIFVLDATGQGAILNQDNTINARTNGAEPGTIIAIFATGAGQMEGSLPDGRIVSGTPKPLLPVGVRIGGRVADVLYAGAGPGQVAGMLQVNARIPADTPRGTTVPVQIIVGTATSQANVFLATRP